MISDDELFVTLEHMHSVPRLKVGEKRAWAGSVASNQTININAPGLFGGDNGEGGIQGTLDVMMGAADQLAPGLAGTDTLALVGRQGRPYPPGQFRIGGEAYPSSVTGDVVMSWSHRDRLGQADQLIDTAIGNIGPESGTTYSARLLRADNNAVLANQTSINGTTVTLATTYEGLVTAELWSVRSGIVSSQWHQHTLTLLQPTAPLMAPTNLQAVWVEE